MDSFSKLSKIYLQTLHDVNTVYVCSSLRGILSRNEYINLLYEGYNEKEHSYRLIFYKSQFYKPIILSKINGEKSIIHHHWFHGKNSTRRNHIKKLIWLIIFRLLGGKIIWTVHNQYPHISQKKCLNRFSRYILAHISNKILVHCERAIKIISGTFNINKGKIRILPHPDYKVIMFDRKKSITHLNKIFPQYSFDPGIKYYLMYGKVIPYKGILEVVDIFSGLKTDRKRLLIAGTIPQKDKEYGLKIKKKVKKTSNVIFINKYITEHDQHFLFGASDYVIFNFKKILTSGSVILAGNYGKPIIAPDMGCVSESVKSNLRIFNNYGELRTLINNEKAKGTI